MTPARTGACVVALSALLSGCFGSSSSVGSTTVSASDPTVAVGSDGDPAKGASGGQGIGDPYYPDDGNLGYDVSHYHVRLTYDPSDKSIDAHTTITGTYTTRLRTIHFDLIGLDIAGVTVDGHRASFTRQDAHELVIKLGARPMVGDHFSIEVAYSGKPGRDPVDAIPSGWYNGTTRGAGFIAGEPHSCTLWYPCNDHPTDKAAFSLRADVPRPFAVVSNGVQGPTKSYVDHGTPMRAYVWRLTKPATTYETTIYIDRLTFERSTLPDGTPLISAYGPAPGSAPAREAKLPQILKVLASYWGPYPAPAAGGIFVNGNVPFSLEAYSRPIYTEGADLTTIVHENGHQWWGDNISIKRWRDICFNECLASYSQWLWDESRGQDLDDRYVGQVKLSPSWFDAPLYDMGAGHEFDFAGVYLKGAFFVHALRNEIGDDAFFAAMQQIQRDNAGGNMSMLDLRDQLEAITGVDLTSFWDEWVLNTGIPSDANLYPGDLAQ